jgi:hypothetical protein
MNKGKSSYKGLPAYHPLQVGDHLHAQGIPAAVLEFCRSPRPWQDVLQRPYNMDEINEKLIAGHFGKVRLPEVYVRNSGTAMFGVGQQYWSHSHFRSFRTCVGHVLFEEIGADFFENQKQLELKNRHPLAVWHTLWEERLKQHAGSDAMADIGASAAWSLFAYQIYLLKENSELPSDLLERLRKNDGFQGARYEVYVAAIMLVSGYKIEWIPHSSETHVEFIATHPDGRKFAVEAKSKHRLGVLKAGATDAPEAPFRIDFQSNIVAGIRKNPELPLLLFAEVNVPYNLEQVPHAMMHEIDRAWTKKLDRRDWEPEGFPCVGLLVTNDTLNWKIPSEVDMDSTLGWVWSKTGQHRHQFDATPYLQEIVEHGRKANFIPNILWNNTNPPQSRAYSK